MSGEAVASDEATPSDKAYGQGAAPTPVAKSILAEGDTTEERRLTFIIL
tara:strand:+ start:2752 stop:2898 length:147 start_codon:yes stop_codon:yes gene_type:complete